MIECPIVLHVMSHFLGELNMKLADLRGECIYVRIHINTHRTVADVDRPINLFLHHIQEKMCFNDKHYTVGWCLKLCHRLELEFHGKEASYIHL